MRRLLVVLGLAATVGCGGDTPVTPATVAGTWSLNAADGKPLPYLTGVGVGAFAGAKIEVVDDHLSVAADGTFTEAGHQRTTNPDGTVRPLDAYLYSGTYVLAAPVMAFAFQGGLTGTGSVSGGTMIVSLRGASFTYVKQ